jgi:hypothetical protein
MWNGSGFDVNQNWAKRPGGGEGAYAIRQWGVCNSGRLWIAFATLPSEFGLGLGIGYDASLADWRGGCVALKRFPTLRDGSLEIRRSASWACPGLGSGRDGFSPLGALATVGKRLSARLTPRGPSAAFGLSPQGRAKVLGKGQQ